MLSFEAGRRLTDQMETQLKELTDLAQGIVDPFEPWTNADATALDRMSVADWLAEAKCSELCKRAIAGQLSADNGVPAANQSFLGVLAMIRGGGLDRYWTDTELVRCRGGNQQLPEKFAAALNTGKPTPRVLLNSPVTAIRRSKDHAVLVMVKGAAAPAGPFHDVILAIPPSVWHTIELPEAAIGDRLRNAPQMGANVKYLMRLGERVWESFASSPNLTEDGPVDLTWETTEQEKHGDFAFVAFSGADHAQQCRTWSAESRRSHYIEALAPYPGIEIQIRAEIFCDWPGEEWTQASYYFPRVGEVTRWGPLWKTGYGGWLHFAGEHTCSAFVGYMEGALSSGYRLARRLAVRHGILSA